MHNNTVKFLAIFNLQRSKGHTVSTFFNGVCTFFNSLKTFQVAKTFLNLNNKCCLKPPDCANQVCVSASKLPNYIQMLSVQQSVYNNKDVSKGLHIKLQTYNYRK